MADRLFEWSLIGIVPGLIAFASVFLWARARKLRLPRSALVGGVCILLVVAAYLFFLIVFVRDPGFR